MQLTMQLKFFPALNSRLMMLLLLLIAALVTTSLDEKVQVREEEEPGGSLKGDDGGESVVDPDALVSDLQNKKRVIFAVGPVSSKMTLFISGPGGKSDMALGCTVQVEENSEGVFKITDPPGKMPAGVASADVMFVCVDADGSRLVTMSSGSVSTVKLPDGGSEATKITKPSEISHCFDSGSIHLSSSESLHYYTVGSGGEVSDYNFKKSITSSKTCGSGDISSKLCISDDKITIKEGCSGSSISGIVSGYVGSSTAYLFASDNAVYVFAASAFTSGQTTDLKKVEATDAWRGKPPAPQPHPHNDNSRGGPDRATLIKITIVLWILYCLSVCGSIGGSVWYFYFRDKGGKNSKKGKDMGKGHHSRKSSKDSNSKHGGKNKSKSSKSSKGSSKGASKSSAAHHTKSKQVGKASSKGASSKASSKGVGAAASPSRPSTSAHKRETNYSKKLMTLKELLEAAKKRGLTEAEWARVSFLVEKEDIEKAKGMPAPPLDEHALPIWN